MGEEKVVEVIAAFIADYIHPRGSQLIARDIHRAIIQAGYEIVQKDRWQDILTVPKDGTFVLAFENGEDIYKARWQSEGYWSAYCGQPVVYTPEPTHWQPLPSKPQADGG